MIEFWKILFNDSWNIYTKNIRLILGAFTLVLLPIFIVMFIPTSIPTDELDANRILESIFQSFSFSEIFFILAINVLITGLYIGMLSLFYSISTGKSETLKHLLSKFYCLPRVMVPDLAIGLIMFIAGVSTFMLIFNLIYRIIFFYYTLIIVVEDTSIINGINKSFNIAKNNIGLIFQFIMIIIFTGILGLFLPILFFGLIPFWTILYIQLYIKANQS